MTCRSPKGNYILYKNFQVFLTLSFPKNCSLYIKTTSQPLLLLSKLLKIISLKSSCVTFYLSYSFFQSLPFTKEIKMILLCSFLFLSLFLIPGLMDVWTTNDFSTLDMCIGKREIFLNIHTNIFSPWNIRK